MYNKRNYAARQSLQMFLLSIRLKAFCGTSLAGNRAAASPNGNATQFKIHKLVGRKAAKSHPSGFQTLYSSFQRRDAPPSLASLMPKYVAAGSLNVCFSLTTTRCVLPTLTRPLHWRPHRKWIVILFWIVFFQIPRCFVQYNFDDFTL